MQQSGFLVNRSNYIILNSKSKEEGKDQESIKSSPSPDPRDTIMESEKKKKKKKKKNTTQREPKVSRFPVGDHNAAQSRQDSIIKKTSIINNKKDFKIKVLWSDQVKKIRAGWLKRVNRNQHHH